MKKDLLEAIVVGAIYGFVSGAIIVGIGFAIVYAGQASREATNSAGLQLQTSQFLAAISGGVFGFLRGVLWGMPLGVLGGVICAVIYTIRSHLINT